MSIQFTELIISQTKTITVMFCAGIFTESLWQGKKLLQMRIESRILNGITEIGFWLLSSFAISMFLYYCSYGRISVHAIAGFLSGLLLWKKMCCDIISPGVKTDEAKSTKTTAKLSTWKRRGNRGWKKDVPKGRKKKRKLSVPRHRIQEGREPSERARTEDE